MAKALDVPVERTPPAMPRQRATASRWDGTESRWAQAAWAAAPWPLWSVVVALGIPSALGDSQWMHGVLALSIVLGAMVVWIHRPPGMVIAARWLPCIVGTGLLGELLAASIARGSEGTGLAGSSDVGRAAAVWLICVAIYEITPMLAAASRVSAREHRPRSLDIGAHVLFLALAAGAYLWAPRHGAWFVSPWIAAIVALPLSAARSGPRAPVQLSPPRGRGGALWGLALIAWALVTMLFVGDFPMMEDAARRTWRRGSDPLEGALWALPALSVLLSIACAAMYLARSLRVRRAPTGVVTSLGSGGLELERAGDVEPAWVDVEGGGLPAEGSTVTLIGAHLRAPDVGPFRDGAPRLSARRVVVGAPRELASALGHRAAGWLVWAAASSLGIWMRLI